MKKIILLFFIVNCQLPIVNLFAQCVPDGSITTPGIIASPSSVDCISQGVPFSDVIQFMNFDSIFFSGSWVTLQQLRIDSVNNLPCGINWLLSNADGIYQNSEQGCISLFGTSYDSIGQYQLDVWASIDLGTGFFGPIQANNFNLLTFYTRVKAPSFGCPLIDTLAYNHLTACNSTYGMGLTVSASNDFLCLGEVALLSANIDNGSGHYSYQWNYADSLPCDTCQQTVFYTDTFGEGTFPVAVTVYDSISTLSATQAIDMIVNICGIINESDAISRLHVYPNPGNGNYTIEFPGNFSSDYMLSLKDAIGREIMFSSNALSSTRLSLNISEASPGIYFLFVAANDKMYVNKLVKK